MIINGQEYTLRFTDGGYYGLGFTWRIPSGGWGLFELAVWYLGEHVWDGHDYR